MRGVHRGHATGSNGRSLGRLRHGVVVDQTVLRRLMIELARVNVPPAKVLE